LGKYILREHVSKIILEEVKKRLNQILEEYKKILSVACAIISVLKGRWHPILSVEYSLHADFIDVGLTNEEYFSKIVSSILGLKIPSVRALFYKYLLGFQADSVHDHYVMKIYPL